MSGAVRLANKKSWVYKTSAFEIVLSEVLHNLSRLSAPIAYDEIDSGLTSDRFLDFLSLPLPEQRHVATAARKAVETIGANLAPHLKDDAEAVRTYTDLTRELADQMEASLRWSEEQAAKKEN